MEGAKVMRKKWFLIPIFFFLASAAWAAWLAFNLHRETSRVLETAIQNDWPVIIADSVNSFFPLAVYTFNCGSYIESRTLPSHSSEACFGQGNAFCFYDRRNRIVCSITLPDYRIKKDRATQQWESPQFPDRYHPAWFAYTPYATFIPYNKSDPVQIMDLTGGVYYFNNEELEKCYVFWTNGDKILYGTPGPNRNMYIRRFTASTNQLVQLAETDIAIAPVSPDGKVMALPSFIQQPNKVTFIDTDDGQVLHEEVNTKGVAIGNRWAVCRILSAKSSSNVVFLDMQNNWERHEMYLNQVYSAGYPTTFALCDGWTSQSTK